MLALARVALSLTVPAAAQPVVQESFVHRFAEAWSLVQAGELDRALRAYALAADLAPASHLVPLHVACIEARRGATDAALDSLVRAIDLGFADSAYLAWEPDLAPLRLHSRFAELLARCDAAPAMALVEARVDWAIDDFPIDASPDGERLLVGHDELVFLLDAELGEVLAGIPSSRGGCARFDPTGARIVTADPAEGLRLWNGQSGRLERVLDDASPATWPLLMSSDGGVLVCGIDGRLAAWRLPGGERVPLPERSTEPAAALAPDGTRLALVHDEAVEVHDLGSGELLARFEVVLAPIVTLRFRGDGRRLLAQNDFHSMVVLDVDAGTTLREFSFDWHDSLVDATFDPRTSELVTFHDTGELRWWRDGSDAPSRVVAVEGGALMGYVTFARGGEVVVVGRESQPMCVYDTRTGDLLWSRQGDSIWAWWNEVETPEGLVVTDFDVAVTILDPLRGTEVRRLAPGALDTTVARPLPDGVHACVPAADGTLRIFDLASGETSAVTAASPTRQEIAGFGGDGTWMATAGGSEVRTWALPDGAPLQRVDGRAAAPDGRGDALAILRDDGDVHVVDARRGDVRLRLVAAAEEHREPLPVWSPNGRWLAGWMDDETIAIWDAVEGGLACAPVRPGGDVAAIAFAPDSASIVALTRKRELSVHDVRDGACLARRPVDSVGTVPSLGFSPDGRHLIGAGSGVVAWTWDAIEPVPVLPGSDGLFVRGTVATRGRRVFLSDHHVHTINAFEERRAAFVVDFTGPAVQVGDESLDALFPSTDERFVTASRRDATLVLDGARLAERYARVEFPEGEALIVSPTLWCAGDVGAVRSAWLVRAGELHPLDGYGAALLDPRRLAARAAGVAVRPPSLPMPPRIEACTPSERHVTSNESAVVVRVTASDALGLVGFQLELDGVVLSSTAEGVTVATEEDAVRATLVWRVSRPPSGVARLRIRAIGTTGVLSRPRLLTLHWR